MGRRRSRYGKDHLRKLEALCHPAKDWRGRFFEKTEKHMAQWYTATDPRIRQSAFRNAFDGLLDLLIHPTMIDLNRQLRDKGMHGSQEHVSQQYGYPPDDPLRYCKQEHHKIHPNEQHGVYFRLSFFGDYQQQLVTVRHTWLKRSPEHPYYREVKRTETSFELPKISPALLLKLVNQGIYQARKLGKELGEAGRN